VKMIQHCRLALRMQKSMFLESLFQFGTDRLLRICKILDLGMRRHHLHAEFLACWPVGFMDRCDFGKLLLCQVQLAAEPFKLGQAGFPVMSVSKLALSETIAAHPEKCDGAGGKSGEKDNHYFDHGLEAV